MAEALEVQQTEHGCDFITLYFKNLKIANTFAERLFRKFKNLEFPHMQIQRKDFRHLPGDPEHFHADGDANAYWPDAFNHFHIIYPHRPTEADWEYLYVHCNDIRRELVLTRNLPIREVKPNDK